MIAAPLPAFTYTQEDADACKPDAMKLCQNAIPDPDRVTLCLSLIQNKRQLSPACGVVMNRPRGASTARPENIQNSKY